MIPAGTDQPEPSGCPTRCPSTSLLSQAAVVGCRRGCRGPKEDLLDEVSVDEEVGLEIGLSQNGEVSFFGQVCFLFWGNPPKLWFDGVPL